MVYELNKTSFFHEMSRIFGLFLTPIYFGGLILMCFKMDFWLKFIIDFGKYVVFRSSNFFEGLILYSFGYEWTCST